MARQRTFLAVPLVEEQRTALVAVQQRLGKHLNPVKWTEPENLHVTLVFLGDVAAEEVPAICRAAQQAATSLPPFVMGVQGLGCFPHARRPRILWAGITPGAAELQQLHDRLMHRLEPLGFRGEDRPYTPHITLGRAKADQLGSELASLLEQHSAFATEAVMVEEVHLYSSELTRHGSRYQLLGRARFTTGEGPGD